jgi:hypothetical protein
MSKVLQAYKRKVVENPDKIFDSQGSMRKEE